MRACAALPRGDAWYRLLQKNFGNLKRSTPDRKLRITAGIIERLLALGHDLSGEYLEVGSGHVPVVPIGLWLAGARRIWTYDLNPRLDAEMCMRALRWIKEHYDWIATEFAAAGVRTDVEARLREIGRVNNVQALFDATNIRYIAPGDASRTGLPESSVDCHFSVATLEHVEPRALGEILREARRILKPSGVAIHVIDPSDHFAHADPSITGINFLQFDDATWRKLAGNSFAYCNRLRASDYVGAFSEAGLEIVGERRTVDKDSLKFLREYGPIAARFAGYSEEDLCTTTYEVLARRHPKHDAHASI